MITYGSESSKTCCIFFHGWTDTPQHLLENTRHLMDPLLFWVIPHAPFKNMWFDYKYTHKLQDGYGKLLENNHLNYKNKNELLFSTYFICNIIQNIERKYEKILIFGTSQGATIGYHALMSCNDTRVNGGWFHNIAAFYPELIIKKPRRMKVVITSSSNTFDFDTHAYFFEKKCIKSFRDFLQNQRNKRSKPLISLFSSKNDMTINNNVSSETFSLIRNMNNEDWVYG